MPVAIFKRDESSATNTLNVQGRLGKYQRLSDCELTSDRFGACGAALGEQFSEAIGTVRFLVATSEALSSKWNLAMSASEALTMPWIVLVSYTAGCDDLEEEVEIKVSRGVSFCG